jgi:hypothetical protein
MIGDRDVKAIGADERDDREEEKRYCREVMHDDSKEYVESSTQLLE